ncbi:hypothetical protein BDV30DRAFT_222317 [Aspergillus minisclerotigenes]|uniref:Zn(2)-C6 fungal-type domain-containing protein n=1 Tax=Aspergillus minisclerotigenes TaxID=656917 RepID=A0A5N6JJL4_9EURO|nr:hypothetical protein BDV30DRAFT_222317 [Aspergillus minisclerotigenes]
MNANCTRNVSRTQIASTARLSCEGCTKRKVKCDRLIPCTNCRNSGILCIPVERRRLPRGRSRRSVDLPSSGPSVQTPNILSTQDLPFYTGELDNTPRHNRACARLIPNGMMSAGRGDLNLNSCGERQQLLYIYLTQVDPLVKILHRPSIQAHLLEGECYLSYEPWHPAPAALASAIYYAASCTVNQDTCLSCFGMDKVSLISKYQKESTAALERADYLLTDDLTVLQAFVISLIAMRCHDRTRRFWTMLALALRIAQALSLHDPSPPFPVKPFEKEMRRRLWHAIGLLDIQASLSSASEPMIKSTWFRFEPFRDMEDDEFSTDLEIQISPRRNVAETAMFHVLSYAQETARQLNISNSRQQLIISFKTRTDELFVGCQTDQNNLNCYAKELAHSIAIFLHLLALRPVEASSSSGDSQNTNVNLLRLAVEALDSRCRVYSSARTEPWRWIAPLFFPWQALATSLAEIIVCDDLHFVRSVWPLIEQSYESFITLGIESPYRRLQESMKEKMERARSFYDSMLLPYLSSGGGGSALSWGLSPLTMFQYQDPPKSSESRFTENTPTRSPENLLPCSISPQQIDFSTWNGDSKLSQVDLTAFESQFQFEDTATFDASGVSEASYEELFLQYIQH